MEHPCRWHGKMAKGYSSQHSLTAIYGCVVNQLRPLKPADSQPRWPLVRHGLFDAKVVRSIPQTTRLDIGLLRQPAMGFEPLPRESRREGSGGEQFPGGAPVPRGVSVHSHRVGVALVVTLKRRGRLREQRREEALDERRARGYPVREDRRHANEQRRVRKPARAPGRRLPRSAQLHHNRLPERIKRVQNRWARSSSAQRRMPVTSWLAWLLAEDVSPKSPVDQRSSALGPVIEHLCGLLRLLPAQPVS
mmetsp:Transcript_7892/g.15566  ORF Transcript_7892/g.15566 Transcript_7892/m.15566 type:complete len:249 (-) Transcript_7892:537-1283(-)